MNSDTDKASPQGDVLDSAREESDATLPEIVDLHQDLGCLMIDAQGEYRMFFLPNTRTLNCPNTTTLQVTSVLIEE